MATEAARRARLFDQVVGDLTDGRVTAGETRYPVLTGTHLGHPVRVAAVVDSLLTRTLPTLLLVVVHSRPFPLGAALDALARPTGTEFYSPNASFAHQVPTPPDFPVHARIATMRPLRVPPPLLDTIGSLLSDVKVKEVLVGPVGARITYRLVVADQSAYRSARRADFGFPQVTPAVLAELLTGLRVVGEALTAVEEASA
ncbi:hypothetical protein [Pseudonocardia spinosispora]|uniref:hypothetical protein n=1 Tax=Pseudonocardia spinosispora TaxID=103441 RepID=UPI0003FBC0BD|nr:hypothetical protein [Pseudonocardia spinosispora]